MNSLVSGKMKMTHLGELVWLNEAGVALKLYFQYEGHDNNGLKLFAHFFELNGAKACEPAQAATSHYDVLLSSYKTHPPILKSD